MATALIDLTIPGLTNEQCKKAPERIEALLKGEFLGVEAELNADTELDEDEEKDEDE